jgi:ABC-2 type transport system ATP-binding protein
MDEVEELCDRIAVIDRGYIGGVGTPAELKSAVGPEATLDDVFAHLTGGEIDSGGSYRETRRARRAARQHG